MKLSSIDEKVAKLQKRHEKKLSAAFTYGSAVLASIAATVIAFPLTPVLGPNSFLLFAYPAAAVTTWYAGFNAGLVTVILTTLASYFFFFTNHHSLLPNTNQAYGLLFLFALGSVAVCIIVEKCKGLEKVETYKRREKEYVDIILEQQQQQKKAQEDIKARDEFLSIASHELKTPLTSMLLQIQRSLHNIRNVSLAQFSVANLLSMLESAEEQSKRLSKMINDLLNVSLITTGRIDLEKEEVDLSEIVKSVVQNLSERIKREGYSIKVHAEHKIVGMFDELRIEQVITNLLTNALRYGEKNPITITVRKNHNKAEIIVEDSGIGIAKEQQEQIFARFARATNGLKYEGLGIGLYITSQIVKAHGGTISVESEEGKGARFVVQLPLHKETEKAESKE